MQAELMYPHIAATDAKDGVNAAWLRTLTDRGFHFTQWGDEKAFKAAVGPKGEKAILNGDILPAPAGLPSSSCLLAMNSNWHGLPISPLITVWLPDNQAGNRLRWSRLCPQSPL